MPILDRLFAHLFAMGVVVVATSNVPPDQLYENGLNRELFLPFIALIEANMTVTRLAARTDFRLEKLTGAAGLVRPGRREGRGCARRSSGAGSRRDIPVTRESSRPGANDPCPQAAMGVARFSFRDLCEQPLAGADYLKIAHEFHTILLDHVPIMDYARRNEAKRFIILIDAFYDNAVKLVASAEPSRMGFIGRAKASRRRSSSERLHA